MTKEQAEAEIKYRLVRLAFSNLREKNMIADTFNNHPRYGVGVQ
ncbi:MAG: hypothetical protein PHY15_09140 [Eubacteriales bacterium]|nr:hypothetical protein [Eubacteriales bacterium]MDD4475172.1 hypothetical protein [Eubacteriales bacterium]